MVKIKAELRSKSGYLPYPLFIIVPQPKNYKHQKKYSVIQKKCKKKFVFFVEKGRSAAQINHLNYLFWVASIFHFKWIKLALLTPPYYVGVLLFIHFSPNQRWEHDIFFYNAFKNLAIISY